MIVMVIPKEDGKLFDVGRMAQNMLVTANALGLASCPVTFHEQDRVRRLLGIPDDYEADGRGHRPPGAIAGAAPVIAPHPLGRARRLGLLAEVTASPRRGAPCCAVSSSGRGPRC